MYPEVVVSQFGMTPKKGKANKWHLITDLSYPPDRRVNDGVSRELYSMHYMSVDTVVKRVVELGPGAMIAKVDI